MSHEIPAPTNGILGMLYLLIETQLDTRQRDCRQTASDCAESLLRIINDILDFSHIEAGKLKLVTAPFDLADTIEKAFAILRPKAPQDNLELLLSMEPRQTGSLLGDSARLRQILTNLLSNALKLTERSRILLRVRTTMTADFRVWARFEVQDTGIGIPAAQSALFESFVQADNSITRKYGGTGLGLAISKQRVEMMGGENRA